MEEGEEGETTDTSCLYVYDLKSYKVIDHYWARDHQKKDLTVYTTLESRINSLIAER